MSTIKTIATILLVVVAGLVLFQSLRLLALKHSVGSYKSYWDTQALLATQPNAITYVALGDSAAQGIGASSPQKGYVGLLARSLAKLYSRPVKVINLSVSGAKVNDVIHDQIPKLAQLHVPSDAVVTLEIGANDMGNFEASNFNNQIETLLAHLPAQTIVSDIPYFGGGRAKSKEPNAVAASIIIAKAVQKYNLRLAHLHDTTMAGDGLWVTGADFFHPSNKGYKNWYQAFNDVLIR